MRHELSMRHRAWPALVPAVLLLIGVPSSLLYGADYCLGPCQFFAGEGISGHLNSPTMGDCYYCVGDCGEDTEWVLVSIVLDTVPAPIDRVFLRVLGYSPETGDYVAAVGAGVVIDDGELPDGLSLEFIQQYGVNIGAVFTFSASPLTARDKAVTLLAAYPAGQLESIGESWQVGLDPIYGYNPVFFDDVLVPCVDASIPLGEEPTWGLIKASFRP
jgi:hypothetical protein